MSRNIIIWQRQVARTRYFLSRTSLKEDRHRRRSHNYYVPIHTGSTHIQTCYRSGHRPVMTRPYMDRSSRRFRRQSADMALQDCFAGQVNVEFMKHG